MELFKLYVLEVGVHKHYFATAEERDAFFREIWVNHPIIFIAKYEVSLV